MATFKELSRQSESMTNYSKSEFVIQLRPQIMKDGETPVTGISTNGEERALYTFLIPRKKVNGFSIGKSKFVSFWADAGLEDNYFTINPNSCEVDTVVISKTDEQTGETSEHTNIEVVFLDENAIIPADIPEHKQVVAKQALSKS